MYIFQGKLPVNEGIEEVKEHLLAESLDISGNILTILLNLECSRTQFKLFIVFMVNYSITYEQVIKIKHFLAEHLQPIAEFKAGRKLREMHMKMILKYYTWIIKPFTFQKIPKIIGHTCIYIYVKSGNVSNISQTDNIS